jgi:hypothetical protein
MQKMPTQESVYLICDIISNVRHQTDVFNPESTRIRNSFWYAFFLHVVWQCQPANVFPQALVQEVDASHRQLRVMFLGINGPNLGLTSTGKVIVERRVQNTNDVFCFANLKNTS